MLNAILWGAIQGLTEFLPISSSGHLVLVPALLGRDGPDLATSAMLHLGTLAAVGIKPPALAIEDPLLALLAAGVVCGLGAGLVLPVAVCTLVQT